ncbi:tripartite tricarboxylate transporter substrate-binding protein [Cupriavidus sp. CP313]
MTLNVIVVPSQSSIVSLSALIEAARKRPGGLTYSTPGNGNSVHLGGVLLWQRAGIGLLHVPYNGAAPAVQAVLSGQVDCGLTALPAAKAHIAAGSLRVLAVGSLRPLSSPSNNHPFNHQEPDHHDICFRRKRARAIRVERAIDSRHPRGTAGRRAQSEFGDARPAHQNHS